MLSIIEHNFKTLAGVIFSFIALNLSAKSFRGLGNLFRQIAILLLSLTISTAYGEEIKIKSFSRLMEPMTVPMQRKDNNGNICALIKVQIPNAGVGFEGNVVGEPVFKTNEYWVYVTPGTKKINVKVPGHYTKSISFEELGISAIAAKTIYSLVLLAETVPPAHTEAATNYVVMKISPANAIVKIDGNIHEVVDNVVTALLLVGNHTYNVEAAGYATDSGSFKVLPSEKTRLDISLKSTKAVLKVNADTDVAIYVNGNLKGKGAWQQELAPAFYNVELRKPGHRQYQQTVELKPNETFNLDNPDFIPIYGMLNIDYRPVDAKVSLDGKPIGETPLNLSNVIIGEHVVTVESDGYEPLTRSIVISESSPTVLSGVLQNKKEQAVNPMNRVKTFTVNGVSFNMVPVSGGTYQMGSYDSEAASYERYVHNETISDFMIGETEVTQELWHAVMGSNPSSFSGAKRPVENISWNDCRDFLNRLNSLTGQNFRMPTEAEWEYAARGGSRSVNYKYSGSDNLDQVGWSWENSGGATHPVGLKAPNELGIYDMSGNVWEWCYDNWSDGYDQPRSSSYRVLRGGSWGSNARYCRVSSRNCYTPSATYYSNGFRLAL